MAPMANFRLKGTEAEIGVLIIFVVLDTLFLPGGSWGGNYYVSPTGTGAWSSCTSIETPCSLPTAFANASTGDLVHLRGNSGNYNGFGALRTVHSGTAAAKITLQPYQNETVNITGQISFVILNDYWIIKNINFINLATNQEGWTGVIELGYMYLNGSNYSEVRNCVFDAANGNVRSYIDIWSGGHHTIDNCIFRHHGDPNYPDGILHAVGLNYIGGTDTSQKTSYNIISHCTFHDNNSYHLVIWNGSSYNQVINSVFDSETNTALGISINDASHSGITQHNLVDGCVFKNFSKAAAAGTGYWKSAIQLYGDYNSIRRNVFYDFGGIWDSQGYLTGGLGIEGVAFQNNVIYNNVFYNIFNAPSGAVQEAYLSQRPIIGNRYYNNIFYKNMKADQGKHMNGSGYVEGSQQIWQTLNRPKSQFESDGNKFDYNFVQYVSPDHDVVHFYDGTNTIISKIGTMYSDLPNTYGDGSGRTHNIQAAIGPGFVDEEARDFRLTRGSLLIDAGVVVEDPDWGNLPYNGSAPDVGRFEFNDTNRPAAPTGVVVR